MADLPLLVLYRAPAKCQPQISYWSGSWTSQPEFWSPGLHPCFSATTDVSGKSTLPWISFPLTQNGGQWRGLLNACCAQLIRLTLPHHIHPEVGVWTGLLLPTTSYPVVERVALFWLYLSGKWLRGPALSPLLSGLVSLPCSAWEEPPPDLLLSTLKWEVWPLLRRAEHGSCEVPPTSAFWLCWLGIFNLIYLFPLFKTKQFLAHWKKKAKCFVPF